MTIVMTVVKIYITCCDIFEAELRACEEELGKHCMMVGTVDSA
jgi:hypothetical protein